jgi:cytochrome c556
LPAGAYFELQFASSILQPLGPVGLGRPQKLTFGRRVFMSRKKWAVLGLAAIVAIGGAVLHSGRGDADTVIDQRRALMKDNAKQMEIINNFLEKNQGDLPAVTAAAQTIQADAAKIPDLFPRGTSLDDNVGKTGAKPEIWADFGVFKAAASKLGELAAATAAVASTGDKAAVREAFAAMGKEGCGGCHERFRQKLN